MTMGRASMGKQIAVTRSSKKVVKKGEGGLLAAISPAAALAKSLKSGKPEGIMKMTPLGAAVGAAFPKGKDIPANKAKAAAAAAAAGKPAPMKSGGRVKKGKH